MHQRAPRFSPRLADAGAVVGVALRRAGRARSGAARPGRPRARPALPDRVVAVIDAYERGLLAPGRQ